MATELVPVMLECDCLADGVVLTNFDKQLGKKENFLASVVAVRFLLRGLCLATTAVR